MVKDIFSFVINVRVLVGVKLICMMVQTNLLGFVLYVEDI